MNLFAYGTLLVPEIWLAVTGRPCRSKEAILPGHDIRRVRNGDFPGIRHIQGSEGVPGRVFFDLDAETLQRLDAYEDDFYERLEVSTRDSDGQTHPAQAYVVPDRHKDVLTDETWTLAWFREHALHDYLARLPGQNR